MTDIFVWLLLLVPASVAAASLIGPDSLWTFAAATLGVIPLAEWIRRGTEHLAHRAGPAIARDGDEAVVTTGVAVHTEEAVREHAAAEERPKLLLDEAWSGLLSVCGTREEAGAHSGQSERALGQPGPQVDRPAY